MRRNPARDFAEASAFNLRQEKAKAERLEEEAKQAKLKTAEVEQAPAKLDEILGIVREIRDSLRESE